jgi:hypothetical protein
MDKILFTTFLTFLAGFIAAVMSLVNLVNEKERKISEYRKDWVGSLRECFSDLAARLSAMSANYQDQNRTLALIDQLQSKSNKNDGEIVSARESLARIQADIIMKRHEIQQSWAKTRLHFKPNEEGLEKVERKYESILDLMDKLWESPHGSESGIREKINSEINELILSSRFILKTEWENVKRGEPAYQKTKKYSLRAGILMLFLLITIGTHAFISAIKATSQDAPKSNQDAKIVNETKSVCPPTQSRPPEQVTADQAKPPIEIQLTNTLTTQSPVCGSLQAAGSGNAPNRKNPASTCSAAPVTK